jgi:regulatory protein
MAAKRPPLSLKGRALALLAQREHSAPELRRKLLRHAQVQAQALKETPGRSQVSLTPSGGLTRSGRFGGAQQQPQVGAGDGGLLSAAVNTADAVNHADEGDQANDPAARVDAVLEWLQAHGYLSEERFVESRVHARASRYGNLRIRHELAQHGLALPADAAQALKDSEFERAADVWRRKFGAPPADATGRARQARFLAQRGFSAEVIASVLRRAGQLGTDAEPPAGED